MEIKLAGYNIDADVLRGLELGDRPDLTPETLSAAYARISRSACDIPTLRHRACAEVEKARRSNQRIIFGMGHHSVAEHAVFNFDILGVSRLALEELEHFRLVSYTEKSQRYVTLDGDYLLPAEITAESARELFRGVVERQNDFYRRACRRLGEYLFARLSAPPETPTARKRLEEAAKEDARYALSLATLGQVGMTINARNLEHLFRRLRRSARAEVRGIGERLYGLVQPVAPSLILFPDPSSFERRLDDTVARALAGALPSATAAPEAGVRLVECPPDGEERILAALLTRLHPCSWEEALRAVAAMTPERRAAVYRELFAEMEFFDQPPREFEWVEVAFQAVVSAAHFAQLKRHRMATVTVGPYDPAFSVTVPPNITAAGLEAEFLDVTAAAEAAWRSLRGEYGAAADYLLTNAHRRMVLVRMNLRALYHFVRLRADEHAQWDIRRLAEDVAAEVRRRLPEAARLLCGKSAYVGEYARCYGHEPRVTI